jgi:hypothetical protein
MRLAPLVFAAAIFAIVPAFAASLTADQAREQLAGPAYPDHQPWKLVTNASDARHAQKEWIPADQQIESFKDILSAQAFFALANTDPANFVRGMLAHVSADCDHVSVNGPKAATENGVPVAYGQFYCGQVKGQNFGTHSFIKVIKGTDAVYAVNRDFRTPVSAMGNVMTFDKDHAADAMAMLKAESAANKYLEAVHLCSGIAPGCPLAP